MQTFIDVVFRIILNVSLRIKTISIGNDKSNILIFPTILKTNEKKKKATKAQHQEKYENLKN